ncbi:uncharacterized protein RJT20DRAFT_144085 [Scheffersomyces xylosifermentans]|uniref:uncharacterized protein n=1 Tax=Scheffersomyces xylosifermentans TaxID=1304137 RepID=UPI00315CBF89
MKLLSLAVVVGIAQAFPFNYGFGFGFGDQQVPQLETSVFEGLEDYKVGKHSLLDFHKRLIDIDSTSDHENNASQFLKKYLKATGLTVEVQKIDDGLEERYNIYAYYGKTRDTKVVVTSHFDTVPPYIPYRIEGTKIYGRGSSDAKGSVAAQVFAFLSLLESKKIKEGDVSLLFVVGEENSGIGMITASKSLGAKWGSAIFGEPTELKLGVGHKGIFSFKLTANGLASHSGYPQLGISASEILIPVLNDLLHVKFPVNALLGPSTLNIGTFSGGLAGNVVPAHAEALIVVRVAGQLDVIADLVKKTVGNIEHLDYEVLINKDAVYLDHEVPGFDTIVLAYGTDVPNLQLDLKYRYLYGPGSILVAHGDNEHIDNSDLIEAVKGYKELVHHVLANSD